MNNKLIVSYETHVQLEKERLVAKVASLEEQLRQPDLRSKQRTSIKKKIATARKQLQTLDEPRQRDYDTLLAAMEAKKTLFHHTKYHLYYDVRKSTEGPGERQYRDHHDLDVERAGSPKTRDVPEHNDKELKGIYHCSISKPTNDRHWVYETHTLTHLRAGANASNQLSLLRVKLGRLFERMNIDEQIDEVGAGSLSHAQLKRLPIECQQLVHDYLRPSVGFSECTGGLAIVVLHGYLDIPVSDYDDAFIVESVSKGLVNYTLNMDYVKRIVFKHSAWKRLNVSVPTSSN